MLTDRRVAPKLLETKMVKVVYDALEKEGLFPIIGGGLATMVYSNGSVCTECDFNFGVRQSEFHLLETVIDSDPKYEWWNKNLKISKIHLKTTPIVSSFFKYDTHIFRSYFDVNFATTYAINNFKIMNVDDYQFRFLPLESLCLFKYLDIDEFSGTYGRHFYDVDSILQHAHEDEIEKIDEYVTESLNRWQGENSLQLDTWKKMVKRQWTLRASDPDVDFDRDIANINSNIY